MERNKAWITDSDIEAIAASLDVSVSHVLRAIMKELSKTLKNTTVAQELTNLGE